MSIRFPVKCKREHRQSLKQQSRRQRRRSPRNVQEREHKRGKHMTTLHKYTHIYRQAAPISHTQTVTSSTQRRICMHVHNETKAKPKEMVEKERMHTHHFQQFLHAI